MGYLQAAGQPTARTARQYLAAVVGILGCLVVVGWLVKSQSLVQVSPNWAPMQYKTAIGFVLSGLALSFFYLNCAKLSFALAFSAAVVGASSLVQHFLQIPFGIETLLQVQDFTGQSSPTGGMTVNTAISLLLISASILLLSRLQHRFAVVLTVTVLASAVLGLGCMTFLGYLTGLNPAFGWGSETFGAIHSAVGFICLSISLLWFTQGVSNSDQQFHRWLFAMGVPLLLTVLVCIEIALANEKKAAIQESLRKEAVSVASQLTDVFNQTANTFDRMGDRWIDADQLHRERWLADARAQMNEFAAISTIEWLTPDFTSHWLAPPKGRSIEELAPALSSMFKAINTNRSQYSPVLQTKNGHEVLLIYPLNDRSVDRGWLIAVISLTRLLEPVTARLESVGLSGRLIHSEQAFIELSKSIEVKPDATGDQVILALPGQDWALSVETGASFDVLYQTPLHRLLTSMLVALFALSAWVLLQFIKLRTQQDQLEVFDTLSDAVLVTSEKGLIEAANRTALAMFAAERGSLVGAPLHRFIPEAVPHGSVYGQKADKAAGATGADETERMLTAFDSTGKSFPVDVTRSTKKLSRGIRGIHVIRDLTEKLRLEKILNEKIALLDTAVNASAVGFATQDASGRIIQVNDALCRWLGYAEFELLGKALGSFMADAKHVAIEEALQGFVEGESQPVRREVRCLKKNGQLVWGLLSAAPILDNEGKLVLITVQIIDMAHEKDLALKLEEKNQQLEEKNEELDQFAYIASHDLKEPLRTLRAYSNYLIKDLAKGDHQRVMQDAEFIGAAAHRMTKLIDDLLQFSRVLNSDFKFRDASLSRCLQYALDHLQSAITDSDAQVVTLGDLPEVRGDFTQLSRVFLNLIGNAIKFRRADVAPIITVTAGLDAQTGTYKITVADNGIGIAPEHMTDIFKPFKRLHSYAKYEGNGIGLAMVKKIIDRHGGNVEVESKPGDGARFIFTLPAAHGE